MKAGFAASVTVIAAAFCIHAPAVAEPVQFVIGNVSPVDGNGWTTIDVLLLNGGPADQDVALPDQIPATVTSGVSRSIQLERAPGEAATVAVPVRGFARTRYRAMIPAADSANALISVPAWNTPKLALAPQAGAAPEQHAHAGPTAAAPTTGQAEVAESYDEAEGGLLRNLSAHEPTYLLAGNVKDSEVLIQGSFKYRVFGSSQPQSAQPAWDDGVYFAYTQKLFFDLKSDSSIETDYRPEIFYRTPAIDLADGMRAGIDFGAHHESNGKAGVDSRSANTVYVAPAVMWDLGGFDLTISPRAWLFVGGRADNPDIKSYRGNTALSVQLGQRDGLQLSTTGRMNVSNGRGALLSEVSYPLSKVSRAGDGFFVFSRFFTGYGENLLNYNRSATRFRVGFGIAR